MQHTLAELLFTAESSHTSLLLLILVSTLTAELSKPASLLLLLTAVPGLTLAMLRLVVVPVGVLVGLVALLCEVYEVVHCDVFMKF
jgi:hypothetical protein